MKSQLYFPVAGFIAFWARLVLLRWKPKIVVIMGSAGKTTTMCLLKNVLEKKHSVFYSNKANSAIGIPLNILGMTVHEYSMKELLLFACKAPFACIKYVVKSRRHSIYLVEADADRPKEMKFITSLLHPHYVVWVSSFATHTQNFESMDAVAAEFATAITHNPSLIHAWVSHNIRLHKKLNDTSHPITYVHNAHYSLPYVYPPDFGYIVGLVIQVGSVFDIQKKEVLRTVETFTLPPGRCTILRGIRNTTILDSTYNSSPDALLGIMEAFSQLSSKRKIAVLGDMRELGSLAEHEHVRIARALSKKKYDHVVLVGPTMKAYVSPFLLTNGYSHETLHEFMNTYQAGMYVKQVLIRRGDAILLKASQNTLFFEIIAELLLEDPADVAKLCRREAFWEKKRGEIKKQFYDGVGNS